MSAFSDWLESGWKSQRATETASGGIVAKTWNDSLTSLEAIFYQASAREIADRAKSEVVIDGFVEMDALDSFGSIRDITEKDRFVSPRGEIFEIISKENPHNLNEFVKFEVVRRDSERQDE